MSKRQPEHLAKKGGNTGTILIIVGAVVIVALVVVIILLLTGRNNGDAGQAANTRETREPVRNTVVTRDNVESVLDELMDEAIKAGNYRAIMNTNWTFRDGTSVSENAYVENAENNTNDVYFDVELEDTGEIIYSSPLLPLGSYIDSIALDKDLDAGVYPCIITYTLVDENQEPLSTLKMTLTVEVEN